MNIETIFMNTEHKKTSKSYIFRLNVAGKLDFEKPNKKIATANFSVYYTWRNMKTSAHKNNKSKIIPKKQ